MVNYSNGKVYKIQPICEYDEGDIYIGSTTKQYLSQRMDNHRREYKRWLRGTRACTKSYDLFEKYGIENCEIILLEQVNAKSKDELIARESYYIRNLKCVNKYIPDRTKSEYGKEYRQNNREKIDKYKKEYYQNNQEKLKEYRQNNQEK